MYGPGGVRLEIRIDELTDSPTGLQACTGPLQNGFFDLLGHSPPYRVWYSVSDPDDDTGLMYLRRVN